MAFIAENDLQRKLDNATKCMIKGHTVVVKIMARPLIQERQFS